MNQRSAAGNEHSLPQSLRYPIHETAPLTAALGSPVGINFRACHSFVASTSLLLPFPAPSPGLILPQGVFAYPQVLPQHYGPLPQLPQLPPPPPNHAVFPLPFMNMAHHLAANTPRQCACANCQYAASPQTTAMQQKVDIIPQAETTALLACPQCPRQFTSATFLQNHIHIHHESNEISCEVLKLTGRKYFRRGSYSSPATDSESTITHSCSLCSQRFSQRKDLEIHMLAHTSERPYACDQCAWAFTDKWKLAAHKRTHSGLRPYRCPQCSESFTQKPTLTRHLRTHTGERPYKCRHCPATFLDSKNLSRHARVHVGKRGPHVCSECNASFNRKQMLTAHRRVHTSPASGFNTAAEEKPVLTSPGRI